MWGCWWRLAGPKPWADALIVNTVAAVVSISPACSDRPQGGCGFACGAARRRCDPHHLRQHQSQPSSIQPSSTHPSSINLRVRRDRPGRSVEGRRRSSSQTRRSRDGCHGRFRHVVSHRRILCRCQDARPAGSVFLRRNAPHDARPPRLHLVEVPSTMRPSFRRVTNNATRGNTAGLDRSTARGPISRQGGDRP